MNGNKHAKVIYNPYAGSRNQDRGVDQLMNFWESRGWKLELTATQYPGHAKELAEHAVARGFQLAISIGGDGTMGEVASGLANSETILVPLPAGTGNSFMKELGLSEGMSRADRKLVKASKSLLDGKVYRMDMGLCSDHRYWLQWMGVGADAYIVRAAEPRGKLTRRLGILGFTLRGLLALPGFAGMSATVTVDDHTFRDKYVMVTASNCRRYAGGHFILNDSAILDDGVLDVWMLQGQGMLKVMSYALMIVLGRHKDHPGVRCMSGKHVVVETDMVMPVHFDGDPLGKTPVKCQVKPGALRLLTPKELPQGLFNSGGRVLD